ncbi:MAG TPA: DUF4178 domain-containing protein [Spirochaetota bacterium]|nr:DUF4178 domain-containing protein [Spirochaetota bacterium]HPC43235.1 DUF4178 domain-containing protein [Spirochaetota bacterium]HPL16525.1 DUF4178 domain-containing protein [Spirochaetota bacterium]HQF06684.1 DUF4178 domain-containing protein [Spirochaetota bacterium]HQH95913.1 DUF4178 domain-containing protein [Spirochaetota bacterium]
MAAAQCASCGAPVEIKNRFSKVLVCSYCGTHLKVTGDGFDAAGRHPKLAEFPSIFQVGSRGTILGKPFTALGRMRYNYPGGHFDEWFLEYDGGTAWFTEDEGTYSLFTEVEEAVEFPDITTVRAGQNVMVGDKKVMVKEKGTAEVAGAEGELSFYVEPGTKVVYMDGVSEGKKIAIEATEDEIELFTGRPLLARDIIKS